MPNLICINRITSFLPFICTLFAFLFIRLSKIVNFEKFFTVYIENGDFSGFSKFTGS